MLPAFFVIGRPSGTMLRHPAGDTDPVNAFDAAISTTPVSLTTADYAAMRQVVQTLYALRHHPGYRERVLPLLPPLARRDPGHDAVMMGYDFHLTPAGPRLIEVNTSAGGMLPSGLAQHRHETGQMTVPPAAAAHLLETFLEEWRRFGASSPRPQRIAIVDTEPEQQFLYPEMAWFAELFRAAGIACVIAEPGDLEWTGQELRHAEGPVELVYNRHTDFYLETPEVAALAAAYAAGAICLSPNPHSYGLLADKRRMLLWADADVRRDLQLPRDAEQALAAAVLPCQLLAEMTAEEAWGRRKELVFKPVCHFGAKGVLLGRSLSRKRFAECDPATTLVQQVAPPSITELPDGRNLKTDLRLFVYRDQVLGLAARLYEGQVTNMRTEGGGFAPVILTTG